MNIIENRFGIYISGTIGTPDDLRLALEALDGALLQGVARARELCSRAGAVGHDTEVGRTTRPVLVALPPEHLAVWEAWQASLEWAAGEAFTACARWPARLASQPGRLSETVAEHASAENHLGYRRSIGNSTWWSPTQAHTH